MHDLINKVERYASLLREEMQKKTASKGTYYRNPVVSYTEADGPTEAENDDIDISSAEVNIDKPFICKGLVKTDNSRTKIPDAKFATREAKAYTFDLTRAEAIFDLLLTEKKVKLSFGHKIPKPEELKGKTFCKYHNSWSHNTNNCVDNKPFPPPAINMVNAQLRIGSREERRLTKEEERPAEPNPVLCSRCEYEVDRSKTFEPPSSTATNFDDQGNHRPTRGRVFDRLGARNPTTSAGYRSRATPRPLRTFKPPIVRDDRWYHIQHGGNVQPMTKTQLRRMQRQAQQTREDPPFSTSGLSSLREFHKDHSALDLYGLTPENRGIVELALKNTKAEKLLITKGSDSAIKAVYQANREARARGAPGHHPDQKALECEALFKESDLEYLRHYFSVTPADTLFGLTTEEKARVKRLDDYLNARDTLAEARQALESESFPPDTEAATQKSLQPKEPIVEGRGNPFFGHEPEDDDLLLETSDGEYEEILKTIEAEGEAGRGTQEETEFTINMVLVLPSEFSAPGGQVGGLDDDVAEEQLGQRPKTKEELLAVAFNEVIPRDDPNKYRHLKPLYISAHVEGVPISKVFVDCGATVNILPYSLMKKLAKTEKDLIPSDVVMSSFVGDKSKTVGVLPLKITVADQTRVAAFYVVESSMDYNILLGRDWIHQAGCIPSSLFQLLFFWDGRKVSIYPADEKPFETNAVQARIYDDDIGWVVLTGHDASGRPTRTTA
ncbi:unnamed protein product [Prunus brigantina]